ncbi:DNA phosphorothioation-dependent restriction protein DptG [Pedobacter deserti]|uniref:DNA phosphorothioation-dependent restriction protein DptG n=1 Tax=Pedobacter deserti TaxID=2817382 RepID=UPI00210A9B69|nr:DNA phosphorothioation-dependent restriction protein DptG [Pedobacter sp. SYSU D00382]
MTFKLNREELARNMFTKSGFIHRPGNKIMLFPFIANAVTLKDEAVLDDLENFKGIAGACYRECLNLSHETAFDNDEFLRKICDLAGAPGDEHLKNIVSKIAFSENGQLILFDILVYQHIRNSTPKENKTLTDIARFMVALWFEQEDKDRLKTLAEADPSNLFYKLILECLPGNQPAEFIQDPYYQASPEIKELFRADLNVLMEDQQLFIAGFHDLLRYYFFKYVCDLSIRLNGFFNPHPAPLYFSVEWEKMQEYRDAMINGWDSFTHQISPIFAHAITLEMLNHIDGIGTQVAYTNIRDLVAKLNEEKQEQLAEEIRELTSLYQSRITDVSWAKFEPKIDAHKSAVEQAIIALYDAVSFQFKESKRKRAYDAYQQWMMDFSKRGYGKPRGQLGYSLAIKKDFLLLLTRLCVGNGEKVRLKEFWEGLSKRGILLDKVSQDHVISHFERVNLLEKKSDSGDAQYIKKFNVSLA